MEPEEKLEPEDVQEDTQNETVEEEVESAESEENPEENQQETEEETVFVFDEEEEQKPEEDSTVIRTLREVNRKMKKELKELKAQKTQEKALRLPPEPTIEDCDMDEELFKKRLREHDRIKAEIEAKENKKEEQKKKALEEWQQKKNRFNQKKKELMEKSDDIEEKQDIVLESLGNHRTAAIIDVCDNAVEMIQALGSNPGKLKQLAGTNDAQYLFVLGQLSREMKTITRKPTTKPERVITGDKPVSSGETDRKLKQLRAEATKTGDLTKVVEYRRQLERAGK
jgi:hypothetical protein